MRAVILSICVAAGCTSTDPAPVTSTPPAKADSPAKAEPPAKADAPAKEEPPVDAEPPSDEAPQRIDTARWSCTTDEECTQTCALGAVNAAWIKANPNLDTCDDGCYWKDDGVACRDGSCVTLTASGEIDTACTRVTKPNQ